MLRYEQSQGDSCRDDETSCRVLIKNSWIMPSASLKMVQSDAMASVTVMIDMEAPRRSRNSHVEDSRSLCRNLLFSSSGEI